MVSVNDDAPMPYLPLWMPGMMVSKVALTSVALSPRTWVMAVARSASMPTMVEPSGAMNSSGA